MSPRKPVTRERMRRIPMDKTMMFFNLETGQYEPVFPYMATSYPPGKHPEDSCIKKNLTLVRIYANPLHEYRPRGYGYQDAWRGPDLKLYVVCPGEEWRDEVTGKWPKPTKKMCELYNKARGFVTE